MGMRVINAVVFVSHADYSKRYKRYYYCNDAIGFNSWDMPKKVHLIGWISHQKGGGTIPIPLRSGLAGISFTFILPTQPSHCIRPPDAAPGVADGCTAVQRRCQVRETGLLGLAFPPGGWVAMFQALRSERERPWAQTL